MPNPALDAALRWLSYDARYVLLSIHNGDEPSRTASDALVADMRLISAELDRQDEDYGDAAERLTTDLFNAYAKGPERAKALIVAALVDAARAGREQMRVEMGAKCACQVAQAGKDSTQTPPNEEPAADSRSSIVGQRGAEEAK